MSDRELLEAAAKAAGYACVWGVADGPLWWHDDPDTARLWNPLTDDGDALRLAVKLFLWQAVRDGYQHVDSGNDFYAATAVPSCALLLRLERTNERYSI